MEPAQEQSADGAASARPDAYEGTAGQPRGPP